MYRVNTIDGCPMALRLKPGTSCVRCLPPVMSNAWLMLKLSHGTSAEARHGGRLWHYIIGGYLAVHDASSCILFPTFCDSTGNCKQSVGLSRNWSRIVSPSVWGAPQKSKPSLVVTMLLVLYVVVGTASFVVGKTVTGIVVDNWLAMCVCGGFVCDAYVMLDPAHGESA